MQKSGKIDHYGKSFGNSEIFGDGKIIKREFPASEGSVNRFYSLDAWALKRNITLTEDSAFFDVPKPSKAEKNAGLGVEQFKNIRPIGVLYNKEEPAGFRDTLKKNNHPTTKPVKLFCYLSKLFCQPNGIILDPFLGSGTTGVACAKMGFDFIGIEKEAEYFAIAKARIENERKQTRFFTANNGGHHK